MHMEQSKKPRTELPFYPFKVARNEKQWRHWYDKEAPEVEIIPDGYNNALDVFHRLLLVRCWSPDRTLSQARKYIADTLGDKYANGVILDVEKMWEESDAQTPLVGLLSMGSDPTANIESLGKKNKIGKFSSSLLGLQFELRSHTLKPCRWSTALERHFLSDRCLLYTVNPTATG